MMKLSDLQFMTPVDFMSDIMQHLLVCVSHMQPLNSVADIAVAITKYNTNFFNHGT